MFVVVVKIQVVPDRVNEFVAETRKNHEATRKEAGNLRFDVIQKEDDPASFVLYEVYKTKEDHAAHQKTPYYFAWREAVAPWMAQPREGPRYRSVFPEDPNAW